MNILIIYATYSSSTLSASWVLEETLKQYQHAVTLLNAATVDPSTLQHYDAILIGSPSWMIAGKDAQPHHSIIALMDKMANYNLQGKPCAVFGMGDTSFAHFCGAVDKLETFITHIQGNLIVPSLKIDGFYFDQKKHETLLKNWAEKLVAHS